MFYDKQNGIRKFVGSAVIYITVRVDPHEIEFPLQCIDLHRRFGFDQIIFRALTVHLNYFQLLPAHMYYCILIDKVQVPLKDLFTSGLYVFGFQDVKMLFQEERGVIIEENLLETPGR